MQELSNEENELLSGNTPGRITMPEKLKRGKSWSLYCQLIVLMEQPRVLPAIKKERLFNNNRRLERQGGQGPDKVALLCLRDVDRSPRLLLEERLCGLEDGLLANRTL
jgi:hypothetical protein